MPVAGIKNSGLVEGQGFKMVTDPYTGEQYVAVRAIRPDWAIIHVHEADAGGNLRIYGSKFEDILLAMASRNVLATCERVVPGEQFKTGPERTDLPGFLVTAVVEAPGGALPCGCAREYAYDKETLLKYMKAAGSEELYREFIHNHITGRGGAVR